MRFDILTLFPELFDSVFSHSIVKRAVEAGQVSIAVHNIRDYALDKHHITDDMPYGGGGGMVMKVEPIVLAVEAILGADLVAQQRQSGVVQTPVVLLTPTGRLFSQQIAHEYEQQGHVVLICGRYEGVDERVTQLAVTEELSIGDYVLSGGEIPAMVIVEAVTRLVPGVLGDMRAIVQDSHASGLLEHPHYTRPAEFRGLSVPEPLLSGNHAHVAKWRREQSLLRTRERRPDLLPQEEPERERHRANPVSMPPRRITSNRSAANMPSHDPAMRDKWFAFLAGEDTGPMVSPLCDDWALDIPYAWPFDEPEPFPAGHRWHPLCEQMAMAAVCGWDPTLLAALEFRPLNPAAVAQEKVEVIPGGTRITALIHTPYGDLTNITDTKATHKIVKEWLETEDDFYRMAWLTEQQAQYDEDEAIAQGRLARAAIGERGVLGVWIGPPLANNLNSDAMYYHMADWPDAFETLHQATRALTFKQIETYRKAGWDYIFYCVYGTEWLSPQFFREHILEDTREILTRWRASGGFTLWHSCGQVARLIEAGFYNDLRPEILETLSEPPVGNLPSLRWARERLDPAIATKGNIPLNVLLLEDEESVRAEVQRVRSETQGYRHIVGLSDDLMHHTPLLNARAFVEETRKG